MDVLVLIDKLDDLVHNAKAVPLTDQVRLDPEEIYDILDQMRATIREEIQQARWDTYLVVASKRDRRRYADRPIPDDVVTRILDAGRLAGSAVNRQPWTFVVIDDPELKARLAETVYAGDNLRGAALAIAIATKDGGSSLDVGR